MPLDATFRFIARQPLSILFAGGVLLLALGPILGNLALVPAGALCLVLGTFLFVMKEA